MLRRFGKVVDPGRGGGRSKVAGHSEVINIGPFGEASARLFVAEGATRGEGEGAGAHALINLGALEELRGHVAVSTPNKGTIEVLGLANDPVVQLEVTSGPALAVPVVGAGNEDRLRSRRLNLSDDSSSLEGKRLALPVSALKPAKPDLAADEDGNASRSTPRVIW